MFSQHKKKIIYVTIGIILLSILYTLKNTSYFTRIFGFILSVLIFHFINYFFKLGFKTKHYLILILISTAGILFSPLYFISPDYDKILHFIIPVLLGVLVFFLINKTELKFSTKLMITFAFMISLLALFEIGEYSLDQIFSWKLQGVYLRDYTGITKLKIIQDKNDDTMIDLILGTIGSLIFITAKIGIFYYQKLKK